MFIVISRSDSIRLPPSELGKDVSDLLSDEIDVKYANRVVPDVGLAICLFAIDKVSDPFVLPGDGGAHVHGARQWKGWPCWSCLLAGA
jgi:DNA-directed RNA polymerase III subunit RPC8